MSASIGNLRAWPSFARSVGQLTSNEMVEMIDDGEVKVSTDTLDRTDSRWRVGFELPSGRANPSRCSCCIALVRHLL